MIVDSVIVKSVITRNPNFFCHPLMITLKKYNIIMQLIYSYGYMIRIILVLSSC